MMLEIVNNKGAIELKEFDSMTFENQMDCRDMATTTGLYLNIYIYNIYITILKPIM